MVAIYVVLGALLAIALVAALVRDLADVKTGHRKDRPGTYDPREARLGGPHVNLTPNLPSSDRGRRLP
jgi:hypothetical protein